MEESRPAEPADPDHAFTGPVEEVNTAFRARYFYVAYMRTLCEGLALEMGFSEDDAFDVKLALDEVLSNAITHGCDHYGEDRVSVRISFDEEEIIVCVRDPGGKPFDHEKYRKTEGEFPDFGHSGLLLVHRFMDVWTVRTRPEECTEVTFLMRRNREARDGQSLEPQLGKA